MWRLTQKLSVEAAAAKSGWLENGTAIPAGSKIAERDATKAYMANAAGSVPEICACEGLPRNFLDSPRELSQHAHCAVTSR